MWCCRSFLYDQNININVSFISKVRATGGLGELCCCQSIVFDIKVSFLSKEWVTGGFCGVRLSLAPVWGVAALQVGFLN